MATIFICILHKPPGWTLFFHTRTLPRQAADGDERTRAYIPVIRQDIDKHNVLCGHMFANTFAYTGIHMATLRQSSHAYHISRQRVNLSPERLPVLTRSDHRRTHAHTHTHTRAHVQGSWEAQEIGCRALGNIAQTAANVQRIEKAGGVACVVQAMRLYRR